VKLIPGLIAVTRFILEHPMNTDHKLLSLLKFVEWQVATRILKKRVVVPWIDESMVISGPGDTGLTGNIYAGFMEYEEMVFLLHALQPTETFVDVGANLGAYTILASKVVKSRTIAFEPVPTTVERLRDQIQINKIESSVEVRNLAVGDHEGFLFFTNNNGTTNKVSREGEDQNTIRVKASTLDSELTKHEKYFLKIDVEGFEYNVLAGAADVLSTNNVSAIIIELNGSGHEFGSSNDHVHKKLLSHGFTPVAYDPQQRTLSELESYNRKLPNTIYVKDFTIMSERCKTAARRVVHTAWGKQI